MWTCRDNDWKLGAQFVEPHQVFCRYFSCNRLSRETGTWLRRGRPAEGTPRAGSGRLRGEREEPNGRGGGRGGKPTRRGGGGVAKRGPAPPGYIKRGGGSGGARRERVPPRRPWRRCAASCCCCAEPRWGPPCTSTSPSTAARRPRSRSTPAETSGPQVTRVPLGQSGWG